MINYTEARRGRFTKKPQNSVKDSYIEGNSIFFKMNQDEALLILNSLHDSIKNYNSEYVKRILKDIHSNLKKQHLELLGYKHEV